MIPLLPAGRPGPEPEPPLGRELLGKLNWYAKTMAASAQASIDQETFLLVAAIMVLADAIASGAAQPAGPEAGPAAGPNADLLRREDG